MSVTSATDVQRRAWGGQGVAVPLAVSVVAAWLLLPLRAVACPFCAAASPTLSDRLQVGPVTVVARFLHKLEVPGRRASEGVFEVVQILKGEKDLGAIRQVIAPLPETPVPKEQQYLLVGVDPPNFYWSPPIAVSTRAVEYVRHLASVPIAPEKRLPYFADYLNDADPVIVQDAYDEFAKSSYADVKAAGPHLPREKLKAWIADPHVPDKQRRLMFTLLGVCGRPEDVPLVEDRVLAERQQPDLALDAAIACYITLLGEPALAAIEERIFANPRAKFAELNSAVLAIRFHGTDESIVERARLAAALRKVVTHHARYADLVIADLARWEDWSLLDELFRLYQGQDENTQFLRPPIARYTESCPLPKARELLAEMEKIDPRAVLRARSLVPPRAARTPFGNGLPGADAPLEAPDPQVDGEAGTTSSVGVRETTGPRVPPPGREAAGAAPGASRRLNQRADGRRADFWNGKPPPPLPIAAVGLAMLTLACLVLTSLLAIFFLFRPRTRIATAPPAPPDTGAGS